MIFKISTMSQMKAKISITIWFKAELSMTFA